MAVAIGISFPLGEYHATPWDRAVNSGDSEWPPSPWRILRGLLSAWHTRCPEIDVDVVETLIGRLAAEPPSYWLPPTLPSHTRHYLPGVGYTEVSRDTAYTLAPRLQVDPEERIVVLWPEVVLDDPELTALRVLADRLPYLGRAESVCQARLLDPGEAVALDDGWTVPESDGGNLRVLVPAPDVTRAQLEVTPDSMRKARRLVPEGARWHGYRSARARTLRRQSGAPARRATNAMRWTLGGPVPIRATHGVLATSGLRASALWTLRHRHLDVHEAAWLLAGKHDSRACDDRHQHAHWLWLESGDGIVSDLVLWVPDDKGIPEDFVPALVGVRSLAKLSDPPRGYLPAPVHLSAMGRVEDILPDGYGVSARWSSVTPMLTDRHPKKNKEVDWFVRREVERELGFRDWNGVRPQVLWARAVDSWDRPWAEPQPVRDFRRYRLGETMAQRRRGFRIEFELDQPINGPVVLGSLSHFGFGRFRAVI